MVFSVVAIAAVMIMGGGCLLLREASAVGRFPNRDNTLGEFSLRRVLANEYRADWAYPGLALVFSGVLALGLAVLIAT